MRKALRFTKNTVDLIPYVTVELWYIPRADTHSNHLKQRDRLIHPTNQYEFPDPENKYKSAAAPWSVFSSTPPPCQRKGRSGTCVSRKMTQAFISTDIASGLQILHGSCAQINDVEGKEGELCGAWALITFCLITVCLLQKMLLFVRGCGRKEKSYQVCLRPSSKMHVHLKEVFGFYLVLFKVDQSLYFWWTPESYQTRYGVSTVSLMITTPDPSEWATDFMTWLWYLWCWRV